jgi:hypothetical protein
MPDLLARLDDNGLSYDAYRAHWREQKAESPAGKDPDERKMIHYLNYNWERQAHVHEQYTPSDDLAAAVTALDAPQTWMVLTEPWCGDSAFLLPVIAEAAALTDALTLRILLRDDHLDVMDQYLTGGSRSIPKLVALSPEGEEQFTWGPRPSGARQYFETLRGQFDDKHEMIGTFIQHYEDGGWTEADAELAAAVRGSVAAPAE